MTDNERERRLYRMKQHCWWARQQKERSDADRPYDTAHELQARQERETDQEPKG